MAKVYFLIGGNLGEREEILKATIKSLNDEVGIVVRLSSIYETEPWGFSHEMSFLNQVVLVDTDFSPIEVLDRTQEIEKTLGRIRKKNRYSERTIDIDILFYDHEVVETERLEIPHPRMGERLFALAPMAEIAAQFIHPITGQSVLEMKNQCEDTSQVKIYK
jgi:2-amino-4-hydroxy-6-hydroxymethyldihydropteridine diphosphokinase